MPIAVLGAGKMGGALVRGWSAAGAADPSTVRVYDVHAAAAASLAADTGARACASAAEAVDGADLLLVAVKPHLVVPALSALHGVLSPDCLVVSIAAGVRCAAMEAALPPGQPLVRVMPNTPALVGAAASGLCRGSHAGDAHAERVRALFAAVGVCVEVTEAQIDAVIGVAGSASAYFYLIIEALSDGGVRMGLPRDVARTLAAQTALGAAKMVLETGEHPAALKDQVTTPGGTTIAALEVLETRAVRGALIEAVVAAAERNRELG